MDKLEQSQIRLLLEHLTAQSLASCEKRQKEMHAELAFKKIIKNGITIKRAVEICEAEGRAFIAKAVKQVGDVAKSPEAFDKIVGSLTAQTRNWDAHVAEAVRLATSGSQRFESAKNAADELLSDLKMRMFRELEIERFAFVRATSPQTPSPVSPPVATAPTPPKNKGGKPLAAHWDAMWADIAVQLYVGDLKPKSQKQIKDAMFAWFNSNSIDAGDTAVTDRARQLWHKIEAAQ
ncbi:MAG: hypothetical protein V4521_03095 [Pseudomonadota bacterium]